MKTVSVSVNESTYVLAPLNFDQYEECFFVDGEAGRPKMGDIVKYSLANATGNPEFNQIPAGDVIKLVAHAIAVSGLETRVQAEGEAQAEATA